MKARQKQNTAQTGDAFTCIVKADLRVECVKAYIVDMNGPSFRTKATEKWMKERKQKQKSEK